MISPHLRLLPRDPPPLEPLGARRREWRARVLLVLALLVGIYLLAGCSTPEPVQAPHLSCAWPAERCCVAPPSLSVHWLRDLRMERRFGR